MQMIRSSHAAKKGQRSRGVMRLSIIRKASVNSIPALGLTIGKNRGTITAVATLLSSVKDVKFWMLPPNLPAIMAAAEAVGINTHSMIPCEMMAMSVEVKVKGRKLNVERVYCKL